MGSVCYRLECKSLPPVQKLLEEISNHLPELQCQLMITREAIQETAEPDLTPRFYSPTGTHPHHISLLGLLAPSSWFKGIVSWQFSPNFQNLLKPRPNYKLEDSSRLEPTQNMQFIGASLDSLIARGYLPISRASVIKTLTNHLSCCHFYKALLIRRLLGLMASTVAKLFMQPLQFWFVSRFKPGFDSSIISFL